LLTFTITPFEAAADGSIGSGEARNVWYILTDTTDKGNADALGLNWSPKLNYAATGARVAALQNNSTLIFNNGTVDFSPNRTLTPGDMPNAFPPTITNPGSVGDNDYSPLVRVENAGDHIYNAPVIAFDVEAHRFHSAMAIQTTV
jgi:hypothetical protein